MRGRAAPRRAQGLRVIPSCWGGASSAPPQPSADEPTSDSRHFAQPPEAMSNLDFAVCACQSCARYGRLCWGVVLVEGRNPRTRRLLALGGFQVPKRLRLRLGSLAPPMRSRSSRRVRVKQRTHPRRPRGAPHVRHAAMREPGAPARWHQPRELRRHGGPWPTESWREKRPCKADGREGLSDPSKVRRRRQNRSDRDGLPHQRVPRRERRTPPSLETHLAAAGRELQQAAPLRPLALNQRRHRVLVPNGRRRVP